MKLARLLELLFPSKPLSGAERAELAQLESQALTYIKMLATHHCVGTIGKQDLHDLRQATYLRLSHKKAQIGNGPLQSGFFYKAIRFSIADLHRDRIKRSAEKHLDDDSTDLLAGSRSVHADKELLKGELALEAEKVVESARRRLNLKKVAGRQAYKMLQTIMLAAIEDLQSDSGDAEQYASGALRNEGWPPRDVRRAMAAVRGRVSYRTFWIERFQRVRTVMADPIEYLFAPAPVSTSATSTEIAGFDIESTVEEADGERPDANVDGAEDGDRLA